MLPNRRMSEDEVCPVRDELLGELFRADENRVSDLVATVTPDIRARLALYCYHRSHLHTTGLAIAGSCNQDDLVRSGGHVGAFLFAISREAPSRRGSTERIPFAETCNYVERVMENLAVYRGRFGESTAAIEPNLHRAASIEWYSNPASS